MASRAAMNRDGAPIWGLEHLTAIPAMPKQPVLSASGLGIRRCQVRLAQGRCTLIGTCSGTAGNAALITRWPRRRLAGQGQLSKDFLWCRILGHHRLQRGQEKGRRYRTRHDREPGAVAT